jgi:serine protease Do
MGERRARLSNARPKPPMIHTPRAGFRRLRADRTLAVLGCLVLATLGATPPASGREVSEQRISPIVIAVREARPAVVSIQGQKTVSGASEVGVPDVPRQVNGMGTGTIVDERGYILTNYHVVSDVRKIQVTLDDGRGYTADLVANDPKTDLAIIKIPTTKPLPVMRIGTSCDLMEGESVIALGNAFGYQQTVTRGIISALGRDVQVSDTQSYDDLIQTDASINPGNSGGPLMNINGEMIGVNVAVRAGAQGIGFAIPIDDALRVAANLLNVQRLQSKWHGLVTEPAPDLNGPLRIVKVESASPADAAGLLPGDAIMQVGAAPVTRPLDLERALLDRSVGESLPLRVVRDGHAMSVELALAAYRGRSLATRAAASDFDGAVWSVFGLKLSEEPRSSFVRRNSRYRGGMRVDDVRPDSAAARQGIVPGDVLVGMHGWETASANDIHYIVSLPNLDELGPMKFHALRGNTNKQYTGQLTVSPTADSMTRGTSRR